MGIYLVKVVQGSPANMLSQETTDALSLTLGIRQGFSLVVLQYQKSWSQVRQNTMFIIICVQSGHISSVLGGTFSHLNIAEIQYHLLINNMPGSVGSTFSFLAVYRNSQKTPHQDVCYNLSHCTVCEITDSVFMDRGLNIIFARGKITELGLHAPKIISKS